WSNPHFQRFIELYGIGIVEVSELGFCNHWFIINTCICICCCNFFLIHEASDLMGLLIIVSYLLKLDIFIRLSSASFETTKASLLFLHQTFSEMQHYLIKKIQSQGVVSEASSAYLEVENYKLGVPSIPFMVILFLIDDQIMAFHISTSYQSPLKQLWILQVMQIIFVFVSINLILDECVYCLSGDFRVYLVLLATKLGVSGGFWYCTVAHQSFREQKHIGCTYPCFMLSLHASCSFFLFILSSWCRCYMHLLQVALFFMYNPIAVGLLMVFLLGDDKDEIWNAAIFQAADIMHKAKEINLYARAE
ncbi:hypothetical protein ACJX0J_010860, partial [Zea mays]